MKNYDYIGLKFKIADKILILNRYILLILLEKRENPVNINHIFDRKVSLTVLLSKIEPLCDGTDAELVRMLKKKLLNITESDKIIINILAQRKEDMANKISMLKNISVAVRAYAVNDNAVS